MAKAFHSPEYERFRSILLAAREAAGLTQTEVSIRLGRPQSFVAKYERGERRLDVIELSQVCDAIGIRPERVLKELREHLGQ